jgi:hypothetical protein
MRADTRIRPKRDRRLHLLLSDEEWDMLLRICDERGFTVSDVVRQLIRREHAVLRTKRSLVDR